MDNVFWSVNMKDYVFIGWSRNRELAIEVKKNLDKKGFICVIGGVYEDNPYDVRTRKGTVNETINFQMNHCDQAIMLFQKLDDNLSISGNLIYELGYINAQYNFIDASTKLHIFRIDITQADDNLFPSDLHGIWGTNISSLNKTTSDIAEEIADEFINNQKQIKKKNKFDILNNHHFVEYEMKKHLDNPSMSDYDFAQDILVYLQSAFCYQEQSDMKQKMESFKASIVEKGIESKELMWSVDYAILTLTLFCLTIPNEDSMQLSMNGVTYRRLYNNYISISERIIDKFQDSLQGDELSNLRFTNDFCEQNHFEALLIGQMQEHVTYLILVYLLSGEMDSPEKKKYSQTGIRYCNASISNLEILAKNVDDEMYVKLLLSFAYKNLATFYSFSGQETECHINQKKSLRLRREINTYVNGMPTIRPSLKDYVNLEYLLQVVDVIKNYEDKYERDDYLAEIRQYIEKRQKYERVRDYMVDSLTEEYNKITDNHIVIR